VVEGFIAVFDLNVSLTPRNFSTNEVTIPLLAQLLPKGITMPIKVRLSFYRIS